MITMSVEMAADFQNLITSMSIPQFQKFICDSIEDSGCTFLHVEKTIIDDIPYHKMIFLTKAI